jgi:hypothetical protein
MTACKNVKISFFVIILDVDLGSAIIRIMPSLLFPPTLFPPAPIAQQIREDIECGGERLWLFEDFSDLPLFAVAQALSRLSRAGVLERLSKGVYYRARQTRDGKSRPNPAAMAKLALRGKHVFPSGAAAANLLGLTIQTPIRHEVATTALSLPRKLLDSATVVHGRRPEAWTSLSQSDAAVLDLLRRGGRTSELAPEETIRKTLAVFSEKRCFERLLYVADTEPPRVRAIMGAIGEQLGKKKRALKQLRDSLNPFSRFDFGALSGLKYAKAWQAKVASALAKAAESLPDE